MSVVQCFSNKGANFQRNTSDKNGAIGFPVTVPRKSCAVNLTNLSQTFSQVLPAELICYA